MSEYQLPRNFGKKIPDGDNLERDVCADCGFVHYQNPKVVVGSVVLHEDSFLLCRRAINPRKGYWTLPAGFMELGETAAEGAMREAREEAEADITIESVLAVYSIPRLSQVQIMHVARLASPHFRAGPESEEVALFHWDAIPWDELAFPSVRWALTQYRSVEGLTSFAAFTNPTDETGDMR